MNATISILKTPTVTDLSDLCELLIDAVQSGAAVSFLMPLDHAAAQSWWQQTLNTMHPLGFVLIARDEAQRIVGSVQLQPAWAPNQPHRAEVCKLLVHRRARRGGIAKRLMQELESQANTRGFRLLTLDAKEGMPAELLYQSLDWHRVGSIPGYALDPDARAFHATVIYYKQLGPR